MSGDCEMEEVPTTVLCGERCHLGEGPTYDAATDTAWWFDIVGRRLFEARLDTGRISIHSLGVMGSASPISDRMAASVSSTAREYFGGFSGCRRSR